MRAALAVLEHGITRAVRLWAGEPDALAGGRIVVLTPILQALVLNHLPERIAAGIGQQVGPFRARHVETFAAAAASAANSARARTRTRTRRHGKRDCGRCEQRSIKLHR